MTTTTTPGNADTHRRRKYEAPEVGAAARRFARALARRAGEGDTEAIEQLVELRTEVDRQLGEAARGLVAAGYSWTEVADVLGVSRQAARQRFAHQEAS